MAAQLSYKPLSADGKNSYQLNLSGDTFYDDVANFDFGNGLKGGLKIDPKNRSVATLDFGTQAIPEGFKPSFAGDLFESRMIPTLADMTESSSPAVVNTPPVVDTIQPTTPIVTDAQKQKEFYDLWDYTQGYAGANKPSIPRGYSEEALSTLNTYFDTEKANPNSPYAIANALKKTPEQLTQDKANRRILAATEYGMPNPDFASDEDVENWISMAESRKSVEKEAEEAAAEAAAFEEGYKSISSQSDPVISYLNTIGVDKLADGGKRANELIARVQNKTASQADVNELTQIKQSLEATGRREKLTSDVSDVLDSSTDGLINYGRSSTVKNGYDTGEDKPLTDSYDVPVGVNDKFPDNTNKTQTATTSPSILDNSKLDKVNTVDLSAIPKAAVVDATAQQVDVNNPAYKVTPTNVTAGNALKGLIGQARQTTVTDNQLATKATQDLVNNSKTTNWNVDGNQLSGGMLAGLLAQNSHYLQDARNRGMRMANSRGLLNSSIAAGLAEEAAIAAAAPLAQQDAKTYAEAAQANALADNARLNKGMDLNAQAISNDAQTQNQTARDNTAESNKILVQDSQTYQKQADLDQRTSESNAQNKLTADTNYATTLANLNSQNADRTTTVDVANKRAQNEAEMNFATNQTAALTNNAQWQNQADIKSTELDAQTAWNNSELNAKVDMFNAGEVNHAQQFYDSNALDWKKFGITLENDKNKTVAGWNVEGLRTKFAAFVQGERDVFNTVNDFTKLFSSQNFELNKAALTTMLDVLRDDNSAEAQKQRDAILDEYTKENQILADKGAMDRTIYTTDEQVNQQMLDRELKNKEIGLSATTPVIQDLLKQVIAALTTGDMSQSAKANTVAQAYQVVNDFVPLIFATAEGRISDWVMDAPATPVPDSTPAPTTTNTQTPATTSSPSVTSGTGMISLARKSNSDLASIFDTMTPEQATAFINSPEGQAVGKKLGLGMVGQARAAAAS